MYRYVVSFFPNVLNPLQRLCSGGQGCRPVLPKLPCPRSGRHLKLRSGCVGARMVFPAWKSNRGQKFRYGVLLFSPTGDPTGARRLSLLFYCFCRLVLQPRQESKRGQQIRYVVVLFFPGGDPTGARKLDVLF